MEAEVGAGFGAHQRDRTAADRPGTVHQKTRREGVEPADSSHLHQDVTCACAAAVDHTYACRAEAERETS